MARLLTRVSKKTGKLYRRQSAVEAEIDGALKTGFPEAIRRARIRNDKSPEFIHPECLVHLIREAKRVGKDKESVTLLGMLLERCSSNLQGSIRNDGIPNPKELREDILQHLAMKFAEDAVEGNGRLDYFECRFASAFRALRIDFYNREAALANKTVAETNEEGDEVGIEEPEADTTTSEFWRSSSMENRIFAKQAAAFLATLPKELREVVVMHRIWKMTQEQIAERLGVDVKTVFNRLRRVDQKLSSIKEDAQ